MMKATDIMSSPVVTVTRDTTIAAAAQLMLQHRISGLPVVGSNGGVVGILTEGDLLRRAETGTAQKQPHWLELLLGPGRLADRYTRTHARKIRELMSADVVSVTPETAISEIVGLMERRRIKRLPVIDGGKLVGIVSRANLVRALLEALTIPLTETLDDEQIRAAILDRIAVEPWGPRFGVDVTVKDGAVVLHGTVTDDRERTAVKVIAENLPGVKEVQNEIIWVDPHSGIVVPAEPS